ncbi:MAG TPA: Ig-like domain-containing protein [Gemmatimonadales bacterium]|jgi:hypothetical protein
MKRIGITLALGAALVGCTDIGGTNPRVVIAPLLDSLFVGDTLTARQVVYTEQGTPRDPGLIVWSSSNPAVLQVDPSTGRLTGVTAGFANVVAQARSVQGAALVVVSRPLQITLLLDSLFLMPGDTLTVPVHVEHKAPGVPVVWFSAAANAVFDVDSATGKDSAKAPGGPVRFVAHAALGADTTADSGTVEVVSLTDTIGGKAGFAMFGTVIRSVKVSARALTFPRRGDTLTFRLRLPVVQGVTTVEALLITLRDPPGAPGSFPVDSISPDELFGQVDVFCRPPRNWGLWSALTSATTRIDGLSRPGGSITITQIVPVANGAAVSGRFYLPARRHDFYDDPLGALPIRGTFVAPWITTAIRCE